MARGGRKWVAVALTAVWFGVLLAINFGSAERTFPGDEAFPAEGKRVMEKVEDLASGETIKEYILKARSFVWQSDKSAYHHVWPKMRFGWKIVVGTLVAFFGAAVGSVGGVGGGGIFVPMLTLIIGFDAKSSTAISKCMIMGAAGSTVYYNLKLKHPTLDLPIIDYDLAMLFQPMLMLGISIGVAFNVIFADWMVTILLILLFIATSTKAFFKGIETWKAESVQKKEAERVRSASSQSNNPPQDHDEVDFKPLPAEPQPTEERTASNGETSNHRLPRDVSNSLWFNVRWKELVMLLVVWFSFLALQIFKTKSATCSVKYWTLNLLQVPVAFSVTLYEAVALYKGTRTVASKGTAGTLKVPQLLLFCFCGILAGVVGGLLGLGGGFIMGPLFLELGIPPQVSSATATFIMLFSSSMSVVEYYLLKRFPVPYAAYFFAICIAAAFWGQHVIRKLIILLGRASLIIFSLAFVIFLSALTLGGVGIVKMVHKIHNGEYMGFENLCAYRS
uniref:Sulfite exporter TauE/SafE family protein n=1 Tax=Araucaria cunninghamii TaxID=56994 RepID=A0A0D6QVX0_ARACU